MAQRHGKSAADCQVLEVMQVFDNEPTIVIVIIHSLPLFTMMVHCLADAVCKVLLIFEVYPSLKM